MELALSIGVLFLSSAVATNVMAVPAFLTSTAAGVGLLVLGLLASVASPTLALSIIILSIVLLYKRNIRQTIQGTLRQFEAERSYPDTSPEYGDQRFPTEPAFAQPQGGTDNTRSGPRNYARDFGSIEGFLPASLAQELDVPKGQFPTEESRVTADPVGNEYTYRPEADTGSNEFRRFGPQMDKKVESFRYYN